MVLVKSRRTVGGEIARKKTGTRCAVAATVEKTPDAGQEDAYGNARRACIGIRRKGVLLCPEIDKTGDDRADEAAVHDQTADTDLSALKRIDDTEQIVFK